MRRVVLTAVVASCAMPSPAAHSPPPPPRAQRAPAPVAAPVEPGPIVRGPHGGRIVLVAITDPGDAALTADDLGDIRLWPALDGSAEPVAVSGDSPNALALARDHGELTAALLDSAGGIEVLRLTPRGALLGRAPAVGLGYEQVIAISGGFLARTNDDVIVRIDAHGIEHGRLTLDHGEHLVMLAARHGASLAAIGAETALATKIRWIATDGELRWGTTVQLPEPVGIAIALSPDHQRIAAAGENHELRVIQLAPKPALIGTSTSIQLTSVGFIDDDHVSFNGARTARWFEVTQDINGHVTSGENLRSPVAIGDRIAISGSSAWLALAVPGQQQSLGYRDLAARGDVVARGDHDELVVARHRVWLDEHLEETRLVEDPTFERPYQIDATHSTDTVPGPAHQVRLAIVDDATASRLELGLVPERAWLEYDDASHVLAVRVEHEVKRFRLDLSANTVTPLRSLAAVSGSTLLLVDPAHSDGIVAAELRPGLNTMHLDLYREDARGSTAPLAAAVSVNVPEGTRLVAYDHDIGAVYTLGPDGITAYYHQRDPVRVEVRHDAREGALDGTGTAIALVGGTTVSVVDRQGRERWSHTLWSARGVRFSPDNRIVIVTTPGGLVGLDATTGTRAISKCGWGFGLYSAALPMTTYGRPTECAIAP